MFPSKSSVALALKPKYMIHIELIFACGVWQDPTSSFCMWSSSCPSTTFFLLIINLFIFFTFYFWLRWVFIAVRGRSSCGEWGLLFVVVRGLLIAVASLVAKHRL